MSTDNFLIEKCTEEITKARILYVSQSSFDDEWSSTLHTHNCTELFYVTKGNGNFQINNEIFPVKADDLIIVNPMITHTEQGIKGQTFEYIVMGIEDFILQNTNGKGYFFSNYYDYKHEVLFYLKTLMIEAKRKEEGYQQMCQCLLEELVINIVRRANIRVEIAHVESKNKLCVTIENYIDAHFKEDISLDTLSQVTYVSKYHIVHAFKENKCIAPINFLIQKRIEEAKQLLINTNLQVSEIAGIVGFSSLAYFTQAFKKHEQISPGKFRKLNQTPSLEETEKDLNKK